MRSVLNERDRGELCRRVASLKDASVPRWGRMSAAAMLAHFCASSRMALGDLPVRPGRRRAFGTFPLEAP